MTQNISGKFNFQTKKQRGKISTVRIGDCSGKVEDQEEEEKSKLGMICYVGNKFSAKFFKLFTRYVMERITTPVSIIAVISAATIPH
jgi:hypothetical protein